MYLTLITNALKKFPLEKNKDFHICNQSLGIIKQDIAFGVVLWMAKLPVHIIVDHKNLHGCVFFIET